MTGPQLEESSGFDRSTIDYIQRAAASGLYEIRGLGAKRRVPNFDDLLFLAASLSRYPLEGYRERCATKTVLGTRFASKPIELAIPITVAGMSFGALSARVKEALGRAATQVGTSTTTGDGGMTSEERAASKTLVYQCLPSRYGFNPDDVRRADAIEIVIGQGAKPGGGGMLLGQKVNPRVARMRTLPEGVDQRSASRHPDWTGPDDLVIKIKELREITDWEKPIYVKVGATRTFNDVKLAVHAGADPATRMVEREVIWSSPGSSICACPVPSRSLDRLHPVPQASGCPHECSERPPCCDCDRCGFGHRPSHRHPAGRGQFRFGRARSRRRGGAIRGRRDYRARPRGNRLRRRRCV